VEYPQFFLTALCRIPTLPLIFDQWFHFQHLAQWIVPDQFTSAKLNTFTLRSILAKPCARSLPQEQVSDPRQVGQQTDNWQRTTEN
jgi:hypothetical protein